MFKELDFLTEDECSKTKEIVHFLKKNWTNRAGGFLPFYTLGAASYLDIQKDDQYYLQKAQEYNPLLKSHFPLMYERLLEVISNEIGKPVQFDEKLGMPGFHIFLANKAFEKPLASTHFDLQFEKIKWDYDEVDFDHPISFTAAISLPQVGGGMFYWDIYYNEVKGLSHSALEDLKAKKEKRYLPYQIGKLVFHDGLILHQIAPVEKVDPSDERISLQGHGIVCDGVMHLYW